MQALVYIFLSLINMISYLYLEQIYDLDFIANKISRKQAGLNILLESFYEIRRISLNMQIKSM